MVFDPINSPGAGPISTALTGDPTADAAAIAADRKRIDEMMAVASAVVTQEAVLESPYGMMAPASLRAVAETAGIRHQPYNDFDLRRLMVCIDAREVKEGRRPYAVKEVQRQVAAAAPVPVKIPQLPMSAANQWEVMETHTKVCIPGGVYTWRKGLIVSLAEHGEATMQSVAAQGVKLKAYPEEMPRQVCPTCDTSWPAHLPNGTKCPMCYLATGSAAQNEASDREAGARISELVDRVEALVAWAVGVGAPVPDRDGLWDGKPTPGPGKLEATTPVLAPIVTPPADAAPAESAPAVASPPASSPPVTDPLAAPPPADVATEPETTGRRGRAKKDG